MDNKELSGEEKLRQYIRENAELITRAQEELAKREELMKPMRLEDVKKQIDKINEFLSTWTWMDFMYKTIESEKITLFGCADMYVVEPKIEIMFRYPQIIVSPFFLTADNTRLFIELSSEEELREKTGLYAEDAGYVFKLNDELLGDEASIFITAAGLQCEIFQ